MNTQTFADLSEQQRMIMVRRAELDLQRNPKNADAMMLLAGLIALEGDGALALAWLKKALAIRKKDPEILRRLLATSAKAKLYADARKYGRKLCEVEPRNAANHQNHGDVLERMGLPQQAVAASLKANRLVPGKPELEVSHILKNTGPQRIRTNVYSHNFLVIDEKTTGKDVTVVFPYPVSAAAGRGFGDVVSATKNEIVFHRDLESGDAVFSPDITGFGPTVKDFDIRVKNRVTGAGVRLTGDQPLARVVFWAAHKAISPETYVDIDVASGEEFRWVFRYGFYSTARRR